MPVTETRVIQKPNGELTVSVIGEAKPKKGTSASVIINLEEINLLLLNTKDHTGPVSMVRDGNEIRTVANERHPTQISLGKVDASGKVTWSSRWTPKAVIAHGPSGVTPILEVSPSDEVVLFPKVRN